MTEFNSEKYELKGADPYKTEIGKDIGDSSSKFNELKKAHLGNGLLSRWFPSDVAKELMVCEVELAKQEVGARKRIHGVLRELEAQTITELANDGLENFKSLLRKNRGEFFQSMSDEFADKLAQIDDVFEENCMRLEARIEQCSNQLMKQMRVESFKETIENHFRVRSRLIQRFNDILDERIDTLSGKTKGSL